MTDLSSYFARIPALAGAEGARAVRLGGLTNLNYLIDHDDQRFVLRVPGAGTGEYVDRAAELVAATVASDADVNAELVFFDPSDGLMVTRFVERARTMDAGAFADLEAVGRAGEVFRRLHTCPTPFTTDFQLFPMIDEYKSLLAAKGATLPPGYEQVQRQADTTRARLERSPGTLVPSHCDPLCENFLDTGSRMYLIDYEYAANNDPMWDLGDLSVEAGFEPEQDAALFRAYFGNEPADEQVGRMVAYKAMCDLLWTLWGVIQHINQNPAEDFWAYAMGRFDRCQALLNSDDYPTFIAAI